MINFDFVLCHYSKSIYPLFKRINNKKTNIINHTFIFMWAEANKANLKLFIKQLLKKIQLTDKEDYHYNITCSNQNYKLVMYIMLEEDIITIIIRNKY